MGRAPRDTVRQGEAVDKVTENMGSAALHIASGNINAGHLKHLLQVPSPPHSLPQVTPGPEVDLLGWLDVNIQCD